jgi:DNA mismatch endonuclease (patch repair protein)
VAPKNARKKAQQTAPGTAKETAGSKPYPLPASAARSANMKANRRRDTKPELALRSALHAMGYRYRKDFRLDLPARRVRPDIAFTSRKVAVFVDGCFWHACPVHGSKPRNNEWYWSPKLEKNVERDRAADAALAAAGWTVVRLWEHVPVADAVAAVVAAVGDPRSLRRVATMKPHAGIPALDDSGAGRRPRERRGRVAATAGIRGHPGASRGVRER